MSLLSWNCRGSGGRSTVPILQRYLRSTGVVLAFISETKCSREVAVRRVQGLSLTNSELVPSRGKSGGLWLLWANEITVNVLESSFFFIAAEVQFGPAAQRWLLFAIYGDCDDKENEMIWSKLSGYVNSSNLLVCAVGDFNCITGSNEKAGGSSKLKSKNKKFRSFLQRTGLVDLGYSGPTYTWANNQGGRTLILQRLDRGVATADWINTFPNSKVFHLTNYASDHLPILLRTEVKPKRKQKSFRIEQWWSMHGEFQEVCNKATRVQGQSWEQTCSELIKGVRGWELGQKDPNWQLIQIENKLGLMNLLKVKEAAPDERYLGCPIKVEGNTAFDYLVEKFETRLNNWKSKCLSHAGRLILIKSVLDSLPIYAMGTVILPTRVIKKLTAIAQNFFWGGTHEKKSLTYVAWDKVVTPKSLGGLGLRSLKEMNRALVLKALWKLASDADSQWTRAMQAKYYPRSTLWSVGRRSNASKLWRNLMELKPSMQTHILWKIGTGEKILLYDQPWFPNWLRFRACNKEQREATVSSLINQASNSWDFQELQKRFRFSAALLVATDDQVKPDPHIPDTLLFTFAKNGQFSVKMAYQLLRGERGCGSQKKFWGWLWKKALLIPKLKIFVWRLVLNALPVKAVLAVRMHHIDPICQFCEKEPESIMHTLFKCDFARVIWLVSELGLRTEDLPDSFKFFIEACWETLTDEQSCSLVCTMWAIWRSRNEALFKAKVRTRSAYQAFYKAARDSCRNSNMSGQVTTTDRIGTVPVLSMSQDPLAQVSSYMVFVDGSWDPEGGAGIGLYLTRNGTLVQWVSKAVRALNSTQAEAIAVLKGLRILNTVANGAGMVLSDSLEIVNSIQSTDLKITDWRDFSEIWQSWKIRVQGSGRIQIRHCGREDVNLGIAHGLANQGRIYGWDKTGCTDNVFSITEIV